MVALLLLLAVSASGQGVRTARTLRTAPCRTVAARDLHRAVGGPQRVVNSLPSRSIAPQAKWTKRAFEILGFRRNQGDKAGDRRPVDKSELTVVTGGGSGIGRAVALRLARRGMNVVITGRRDGPIEETKAMAIEKGYPGEIIPVVADQTSDEGRQRLYDTLVSLNAERGLVLRGLIHNAAVNTPCKKMMQLEQNDWMKVADINVNGPLFLTQKLYPLFGKTETEKLSFYGLYLMFKEEMSKEESPVYTASLIPGEVDTEMQRQTAYGQADGTFPENLVKYWREIQESGQLLPPEVTGAFMEYVLIDTVENINITSYVITTSNPDEFMGEEWFIYDKKHHKNWAYEFPDVNIVEPAGLF